MESEVFEIIPEVDITISQKCPSPNWGNILFTWMTEDFQLKLLKLTEDYSNKPFLNFLSGVQYEYSILVEQDLNKALHFYTLAASQYESNALYKMYTIHSKESLKFGIKRDITLEKYYLLKAMAFSDCAIFFSNDTLYNIDIMYEIALTLDCMDPQLEKTNRLFMDMKGRIEDENELRFVEAMTLIKFNVTDDDVGIGITILQDLADNHHYTEAIYKLACIYVSRSAEKYISQKDPIKAEKYFKILESENHHRSLNDYGTFLYYQNRLEESLVILKKGVDKGNTRCIFLYYDVFLTLFDFSEEKICQLEDLLSLLVIDVITGNAFSIFEFFYLKRTLESFFKFNKYTNKEEHEANTKELIKIINRVHTENKLGENDFIKGVVDTEFKLSYGFINYVGVNECKDHKLAEQLLKSSFKTSINSSYQRFCYSYIFKLRLHRSKSNTQDETLLTKLEKTKTKIFKIYNDAIDKSKLDEFSSSYFYYLAKLYEKGWGTKQDDLFAYCYYSHASIAKTKYLGTGSIISYFRKFKAKHKLKLEKFVKLSESLEMLKEVSLKQDDDILCYICYENHKDVIYYPCKHMTCKSCFDKLKVENKCPHCRGKIILTK